MKQKIIDIVVDNSCLDTIEDKDLDISLNQLKVDSLDLACIFIDMESKLEIEEIDTSVYTLDITINDLIKLVENDKCKS